MDDGHGKLPLVVLNSTTMASKRQYIPNKTKLITVSKNNERSTNEVSTSEVIRCPKDILK